MKMKKIIACICIICLLPTLFACSSDESGSEANVIDDKLVGAWREYGDDYLIVEKNGELTWYDERSGNVTKANIADEYKRKDGKSFTVNIDGRKMMFSSISVEGDRMRCEIHDVTDLVPDSRGVTYINYDLHAVNFFDRMTESEEKILREKID